jgi:hypothetical protein
MSDSPSTHGGFATRNWGHAEPTPQVIGLHARSCQRIRKPLLYPLSYEGNRPLGYPPADSRPYQGARAHSRSLRQPPGQRASRAPARSAIASRPPQGSGAAAGRAERSGRSDRGPARRACASCSPVAARRHDSHDRIAGNYTVDIPHMGIRLGHEMWADPDPISRVGESRVSRPPDRGQLGRRHARSP